MVISRWTNSYSIWNACIDTLDTGRSPWIDSWSNDCSDDLIEIMMNNWISKNSFSAISSCIVGLMRRSSFSSWNYTTKIERSITLDTKPSPCWSISVIYSISRTWEKPGGKEFLRWSTNSILVMERTRSVGEICVNRFGNSLHCSNISSRKKWRVKRNSQTFTFNWYSSDFYLEIKACLLSLLDYCLEPVLERNQEQSCCCDSLGDENTHHDSQISTFNINRNVIRIGYISVFRKDHS